MIKINLAKRKRAGAAGAASGSGIDWKNLSLTSVLEKLKSGPAGSTEGGEKKKFDLNSPVAKLVLIAVTIYIVDDTLAGYRKEELAKVDAQISEVEKEKTAVTAKLNRVKGYEPMKKQLEDDEKAIRLKLEVVQKLMENRNAPAKMMMQIAQVIPEEVWLTDLKIEEKLATFQGAAPEYSHVSEFIKALEGTSQFAAITPSNIQEKDNTQNKAEKAYQLFELKAQRRELF